MSHHEPDLINHPINHLICSQSVVLLQQCLNIKNDLVEEVIIVFKQTTSLLCLRRSLSSLRTAGSAPSSSCTRQNLITSLLRSPMARCGAARGEVITA